jgi:hypothetical protein
VDAPWVTFVIPAGQRNLMSSSIDHELSPTGYLDLVKIVFALPADSVPGGGTETMWAEDTANGAYRLRNIPFYAMGVSLDDLINARQEEDQLVFSGVIARGGHSTYRVFLRDTTTDAQFSRLWEALERLGCSYEGATKRLIAIDVPPEADIHAAYKILQQGEAVGLWDFQEGHCGHPTC